jgi:hypothetical protein
MSGKCKYSEFERKEMCTMFLGGDPEGRKPLRCGEDYNIKMDLKETGREFVDCSYLAQDRDQ